MRESDLDYRSFRCNGWIALSPLFTAACDVSRRQANSTAYLVEKVRPLGDRLASEAARLPSLFGLNAVFRTALLVLVAIVAARALNGAIHALWRFGLDTDRHLARWVVFLKIAFVLILAYILLHGFVETAPILSGAAIVVFAAVGLATIRATLENLVVGLDLALRRRFLPGDRITVGDYSGTVRETGLMSVRLRATNGTTIHVPNRLLNEHAILVTRAENTARVVVEFHVMGELGVEMLERLRKTALLSPYRSIGTMVRAEVRDAGTLQVEIQVLSAVLVADAETQLRTNVRRLLDSGPSSLSA